jgi:DNA invertase Pin-like site-specific DNA recombinase
VKAYSYIRWSSAPQTKGDSLARQLGTTRDICKQKGWELDETLAPDAGISGYSGDNLTKGSLAGFLKSVEQHRIETPCVLVVEALDRLTRTRLRDARKLFDGLLEKGVQICTANNAKLYDESSLDNPLDLFVSLMELSAANLYSKAISDKVSGAWARKKLAAAKGILLTRRVPAWIRIDEATKKRVLIPEKVNVLQRIFQRYLDGKGARIISRELNEDKIPSFGHADHWNTTTIERLLRSSNVIGTYQPMKHLSKYVRQVDGPPITDYYDAALDKALFYKVQEALKANSCPAGRKEKIHTILTGIATCHKCGAKLTLSRSFAHKKQYYSYLKCDSKVRGIGCDSKNIAYPMLERGVLTLLSVYIVLQLGDRVVAPSDMDAMQGELKDTEARLEKLKTMIDENIDLISVMVLKSIKELEAKQGELKEKLALAVPAASPNPFANWQPLENNRDNRIKVRLLLRRAIESLVVNMDTQRATLKLAKLPVTLDLAWSREPHLRGKNGALLPRKQETFAINGREQPYLDNVVIWKSPENITDPKKLMHIVWSSAIRNITMNAQLVGKVKPSQPVKQPTESSSPPQAAPATQPVSPVDAAKQSPSKPA